MLIRLVIAAAFVFIASDLIGVEAQPCSAGTGRSVTGSVLTCTACKSGYYCPTGSLNVLGWMGNVNVSTFAGSSSGTTDETGTSAKFSTPVSIAIASSGSFALVVEFFCIRRVDMETGAVKTFVGSPSNSGSIDDTGTAASFYAPMGVAISANGTFALIADSNNNRIRYAEMATGVVTTFTGSSAGTTDGIGTSARFFSPTSISISASGSFALITDSSCIRRLDISSRNVTTLAGIAALCTMSGSNDGIGTLSSFNSPQGIAIDSSGSYALVADSSNHLIRRIEIATASVSTLAGTTMSSGSSDGTGTNARFFGPRGIAIDALGIFAFVADSSNNLVRRIEIITGVVSTVAGSTAGGSADGSGLVAAFRIPTGIALDPSGSFLLITDSNNNRIRSMKIVSSKCSAGYYCPAGSSSATQTVCNVPGYYCPSGSSLATQNMCNTGFYCPAGSPSSSLPCSAGFYCPAGSSTSTPLQCGAGFYCPPGSVDSNGTIALPFASTLAGSGTAISSDGIGLVASFNNPFRVAIDSSGSFALTTENNRIRRIDIVSGSVSTLAGSTFGSLDGVGTNALFDGPRGVAIDTRGSFALVVDYFNCRVRRIDLATASVSTLAGSISGYSDGVGSDASFSGLDGISIDPSSTFALVSDSNNNNRRIRRIEISTRVVTTLAGSALTSSIDGVGTAASFFSPSSISIDVSGRLAIVSDGPMIRCIEISTGVVTTLAGSTSGSSDGIGLLASFGSQIGGVAIDSSSSFVLVADSRNNRIRRIELATGLVTTLAGSSSGFFDGSGSSALFSNPTDIAIDSSSTFALIVDSGNNRIRRYFLSSACKGGYYCPAGSSSTAPFICNAGLYCPAGFSSAAAALPCRGGYYCPAGSSSAQQFKCPAGYYCPTGSANYVQNMCSAGYYCPAGSSSSTQMACKTGFYCPLGSPTSTLPCSPGYYCPAGSTSAYQVLLALQSTQSKSFNPMIATNAMYQESIFASGILFAISFGPFVLLIILFAIAFEKYPSVKQSMFTVSQKLCFSLEWSSLDLFFSDIHFRHTGRPIAVRKTAFGATMSLATVASIVGVGCVLGFNSIHYPSYSSSVSPQPPPWQPSGTFQLVVTVYGAGLDSCASGPSNGFGIYSATADWSASPSSIPNVFNAAEGSCQLMWRCEGKCAMLASSYATLQLRSPINIGAWATFVKYQISTPLFASGTSEVSLDFGSAPFVMNGGFYPPTTGSGLNTTYTVLRGKTATTVQLSLTPTVINASAISTNSVAFEPSLIGVTFGDTVPYSALNTSTNTDNFVINFQLNRNVLSFVYVSISSQVVTFLVLLSSVAGSVVTVFSILVKQIESKFDIRDDSNEVVVESAKSKLSADPTAVGIELSDWDPVQKPVVTSQVDDSKLDKLQAQWQTQWQSLQTQSNEMKQSILGEVSNAKQSILGEVSSVLTSATSRLQRKIDQNEVDSENFRQAADAKISNIEQILQATVDQNRHLTRRVEELLLQLQSNQAVPQAQPESNPWPLASEQSADANDEEAD